MVWLAGFTWLVKSSAVIENLSFSRKLLIFRSNLDFKAVSRELGSDQLSRRSSRPHEVKPTTPCHPALPTCQLQAQVVGVTRPLVATDCVIGPHITGYLP